MSGKVFLAIASSILCFCILETSSRVFFFGLDGLSYTRMNSTHPLGESGLIRESKYPEIVYELSPDLDTWFNRKRFRTNSAGFRDKAYSRVKPPGTFRIAVIGDSFTMGSGVASEDTYPSRLEADLNRASSSPRFEVLNFGCGGYGLRQYLAVIAHKALLYSPDLILIGLSQNDDEILPDNIYREKYQVKKNRRGFFRVYSWQWIKANRFYRAAGKLKESGSEHPGSGLPAKVRTERAKHLRYYFNQLRSIPEQSDIAVAAVYLSMSRLKGDYIQEQVRLTDIPFLDLSPAFAGQDIRKYVIAPIDYHPNGEANRIFAAEIRSFLVKAGLIPI